MTVAVAVAVAVAASDAMQSSASCGAEEGWVREGGGDGDCS